jgi:FtsH-binding integral membrane protein
VGLGPRGGTCRIQGSDAGPTAARRKLKGNPKVFQPNRQADPYAQSFQAVDLRSNAQTQGAYLNQAFFWMFAGLLLTAAVGFLVQSNVNILRFVAGNFLPIIIAQFVLVLAIQFGIRRIPATVALGMFFLYAASIGFTVLAIVLYVYPAGTVATAFLSASAMFGGAALYGYTTKRSLASMGGFLFMGVIGIVVAGVINLFLQSDTFGFLISIAGVVLFTILTAFHVQRIANGQLAVQAGSVEKAAVYGALLLYLDFVNLFLFLLRIFGGSRR